MVCEQSECMSDFPRGQETFSQLPQVLIFIWLSVCYDMTQYVENAVCCTLTLHDNCAAILY